MENRHNKRTRYTMAGVGALALAAMGAVGALVAESPVSGAEIGSLPEATIGETSTQKTAPTELETSVATPTVKADLPDGYGNG